MTLRSTKARRTLPASTELALIEMLTAFVKQVPPTQLAHGLRAVADALGAQRDGAPAVGAVGAFLQHVPPEQLRRAFTAAADAVAPPRGRPGPSGGIDAEVVGEEHGGRGEIAALERALRNKGVIL